MFSRKHENKHFYVVVVQPRQRNAQKPATIFFFKTKYRIVHTRYIKILTWLPGFRDKIANLSRLHCLTIPRRDLSTKKNKLNIKKKWPEKPGVMLKF